MQRVNRKAYSPIVSPLARMLHSEVNGMGVATRGGGMLGWHADW